MPGLAFFTICSQNYLGYALTLGRSLREVEPDVQFFIGLADEWDPSLPREDVEFPVIEAREIGLPTFDDMIVRYTIMEFNTAIKARLFGHLFDAHGFDQLVYLDPDILVISQFDELKALLANNPSAVLTPHSEAPLDDGKDPDDVRLLRTGAYNLGFAVFSNRPDSRAFLTWWEKRMEVDCRVALAEGLFVDQKLMDLAPCYMDDVQILRHPGYNVAYWNLMHRSVIETPEGWTSAGQPLRFVHFSGIIPGNTKVFSKHQDRFLPDDVGGLKPLFEHYVAEVDANGQPWKSAPYAYDQVGDLELDPFLRRLYARQNPKAVAHANIDVSTLEEMANEPVGDSEGAQLTRYALEVWSARDDLRAAFDINIASGRRQFAHWMLSHAETEHNIDKRFLSHIRIASSAPSGSGGATHTAASGPLLYRMALPFRSIFRSLPDGIKSPIRRLVFGPDAIRAPRSANVDAPLTADQLDDGVSVYGYFQTETGVGEGARRAFEAMQTVGIASEARIVSGGGHFVDAVSYDAAKPGGPTKSAIRVFHVNADQTAPGKNWLLAKPNPATQIGYWAWELSNFPDAWVPAADHLDEIWVPSRFVKAAVEASVDRPVVCIPHPIEVPDPPEAGVVARTRKRWGIPEDAFVLLNSFDFNSYLSRKNPQALLDAFEQARPGRDDLVLVLKVHGRSGGHPSRREVLDRAANLPGVIVIDQVLSRRDIDALQWASDSFVSLHRSEGFGLNVAECMAKAKPVIATDYSGTTDFVDDSVGFALPYTLVELEDGEYPFAQGQVWADPDAGAAAQAMIKLYEDRTLARELGEAGRDRIKAQFSYMAVGNLIRNRLDAIKMDKP